MARRFSSDVEGALCLQKLRLRLNVCVTLLQVLDGGAGGRRWSSTFQVRFLTPIDFHACAGFPLEEQEVSGGAAPSRYAF